MTSPSFPERALAIRRAAARLCLRLGWAPLHEVALPNGRRADIMALRPDGCFACIEVKSGPRDFLTDLKWQDYREFADELFFAVDVDFPQALLPVGNRPHRRGGTGGGTAARGPARIRWPAPAADRCCTASRCWRRGVWQHWRTRAGSPTSARRCGLNDMGHHG